MDTVKLEYGWEYNTIATMNNINCKMFQNNCTLAILTNGEKIPRKTMNKNYRVSFWADSMKYNLFSLVFLVYWWL